MKTIALILTFFVCKLSAGELELRTWTVFSHQLAEIAVNASEDGSDSQTKWVASILPTLRTNDTWYDIREVLTSVGFPTEAEGEARWDSESNTLVVWAEPSVLDELDAAFPPVSNDWPLELKVIVRVYACVSDDAMLPFPTAEDLFAGKLGVADELVRVEVVTVGDRVAEVETQGESGLERFHFRLEAATIQRRQQWIRSEFELIPEEGTRLFQSSDQIMGLGLPQLFLLGGTGADNDPAYYILMESRAE